uniref:Tc1-like transposase DDE domain-containing protein n=1 Tax=Nothobranchius korthausae TaxID=1143690 RepID=A0A1A8EWS9_9TELE
MKHVYRVPFERNLRRVKELRAQYVQTIFDLESLDRSHEFIFVDEAGFNIQKRRRGRNIIGQRAIVEVPGQRGGNDTICAAISNHGVIHHHVALGPCNTQHLLRFLVSLEMHYLSRRLKSSRVKSWLPSQTTGAGQ